MRGLNIRMQFVKAKVMRVIDSDKAERETADVLVSAFSLFSWTAVSRFTRLPSCLPMNRHYWQPGRIDSTRMKPERRRE